MQDSAAYRQDDSWRRRVDENPQEAIGDLLSDLRCWCEESGVHFRIVTTGDAGKHTIELCSNTHPDVGVYLLYEDDQQVFP